MKHPIRIGLLKIGVKIELILVSTLWYFTYVYGALSVISENTGSVVRIIEEKNIRSMSDALEGYVINANPLNVCEIPDPPPREDDLGGGIGNINGSRNGTVSTISTIVRKWILLAVIYDCDLTTKARNAQQAGYSGLIVQNIGTNNSNMVPWHIMRFPLAKINHVVVGEYDGYLLRYNYSYPENSFYIRFDEDHFYQILCYVLAGIILLLLSTMFLLFWFQICCTIIAMRLPHRFGQRVQRWLHPGKRRLTRPMLQFIPVRNWTHTDTFQVCAICQEDFKEDDKIRVLPCSHAFHSVCIDPWLLKRSRRCPNCMQRVRLPNDNDDDEESEYSPNHTSNRNPSRRRCSQSSLSENRRGSSSNGNEGAPLLELPESPKNTRITITEESLDKHVVTTEPICENNTNTSISGAEDSSSNRDWQLKHFLQNFNYVPSDNSDSQSFSEDSHSGKSKVVLRATDIPLCSMKVCNAESLLETCLDIPRSSSKDEIKDQFIPPEHDAAMVIAPVAEPTPNISILESVLLTRSVSNPGYVSSGDDEEYEEDDDDDDDDQATEEQNLSSSFDATTISESLPRDESIVSNISQATIARNNSIADFEPVVVALDEDDDEEDNEHIYEPIWFDPPEDERGHSSHTNDREGEGGQQSHEYDDLK